MRLLRLLRLAWEAEELYLKRRGRGYALQAGFGAAAGVFALLLLIMLHAAGFAALAPGQGPVWAALILAFVDLALVLLFAWLARRERHDPIAEEALRVRQDAMRQVTDGAARAAMLAPLLKSQTAKKGIFGAAATALVIGLLSRR